MKNIVKEPSVAQKSCLLNMYSGEFPLCSIVTDDADRTMTSPNMTSRIVKASIP